LGETVEDHLNDGRWHSSKEQIQFRNTVLVDINRSEDEILAGMKQKTRYNIRLAARKGVTVRKGSFEDLEMLYQMYAETALRDNFIIREREYYLKAWRIFLDSQMAQPLIAQVDGKPVAALILFMFSGKAWYMYGMSGEAHREKMPNHLLQWEAIRHAKLSGCTVYDMWGAPDHFDENDPMWGVYRFKEGFGGQVARTIGAWDKPVRPFLYQFYTAIMPRILEGMRRRSKAKRQSAL
jgi:lipid II:glycine glycyltransferase (peptidoglycan interpeptide bridge formation enzyme)